MIDQKSLAILVFLGPLYAVGLCIKAVFYVLSFCIGAVLLYHAIAGIGAVSYMLFAALPVYLISLGFLDIFPGLYKDLSLFQHIGFFTFGALVVCALWSAE